MPTEILDGIYDITCRETNGRRYRVFLFTRGTPTLVDAGFADTADRVGEAIEDLGHRPDRLIITHADGDHIGGFDALVDRFDLETWVPEQSTLETDTDVDHRYSHGDKIGRFVAVHLPGHKPDNHALIDEEAGVAVLGDALSGADQRGLPVGYFHLPPGAYSTDLNEAEANLERLLEYEFDAGLVFHGSSVLTDAKDTLERYIFRP